MAPSTSQHDDQHQAILQLTPLIRRVVAARVDPQVVDDLVQETLSRLFGLNQDLPALMADAVPDLAEQTGALAAQTRPVDPAAVRAYLGLYSDGFLLRLDDTGALHLDHDIRSMPMLAMPDGGYVVVDGPGVIAQKTVAFTDDAGYPKMAIEGFNRCAG